jgi:hypothetical protein
MHMHSFINALVYSLAYVRKHYHSVQLAISISFCDCTRRNEMTAMYHGDHTLRSGQNVDRIRTVCNSLNEDRAAKTILEILPGIDKNVDDDTLRMVRIAVRQFASVSRQLPVDQIAALAMLEDTSLEKKRIIFDVLTHAKRWKASHLSSPTKVIVKVQDDFDLRSTIQFIHLKF